MSGQSLHPCLRGAQELTRFGFRPNAFTFQIPAGHPGETGETGAAGEVSAAQLADAIGGTSNNTNAVELLGTVFSDPPTLADLEAVRGKLNELISAARR